jgi:hypothetical protein
MKYLYGVLVEQQSRCICRKYYSWWPFCGFAVDENNLFETYLFLRDVQTTVSLCKNAFSQASRLHHVITVIEIMQFGYFIYLP